PRPDFTFEARYHYMDSGIFFHPRYGNGLVRIAKMAIHQGKGAFLFAKPGRTQKTLPHFQHGPRPEILRPAATNGSLAAPRTLSTETKFTWSLDVGVKKYNHSGSGARLDIRYNPTCINSTQTGYWCDPFYGCYATADAHYFDQWEFSLGFVKK